MRILERLVHLREVTADYTYYGIASPWLQVGCTSGGQAAELKLLPAAAEQTGAARVKQFRGGGVQGRASRDQGLHGAVRVVAPARLAD
jgi:hypothetical protein